MLHSALSPNVLGVYQIFYQDAYMAETDSVEKRRVWCVLTIGFKVKGVGVCRCSFRRAPRPSAVSFVPRVFKGCRVEERGGGTRVLKGVKELRFREVLGLRAYRV